MTTFKQGGVWKRTSPLLKVKTPKFRTNQQVQQLQRSRGGRSNLPGPTDYFNYDSQKGKYVLKEGLTATYWDNGKVKTISDQPKRYLRSWDKDGESIYDEYIPKVREFDTQGRPSKETSYNTYITNKSDTSSNRKPYITSIREYDEGRKLREEGYTTRWTGEDKSNQKIVKVKQYSYRPEDEARTLEERWTYDVYGNETDWSKADYIKGTYESKHTPPERTLPVIGPVNVESGNTGWSVIQGAKGYSADQGKTWAKNALEATQVADKKYSVKLRTPSSEVKEIPTIVEFEGKEYSVKQGEQGYTADQGRTWAKSALDAAKIAKPQPRYSPYYADGRLDKKQTVETQVSTILSPSQEYTIRENARISHMTNLPKEIGSELDKRQEAVLQALNNWEKKYTYEETDEEGNKILVYKDELTENELKRAEELRVFYEEKNRMLNNEVRAFNENQLNIYNKAVTDKIVSEMDTETKMRLGLWERGKFGKDIPGADVVEGGWSILEEKMKASEDQLAKDKPFVKELEGGLKQTESARENINTFFRGSGPQTPDWFVAGKRVEIPYFAKHTFATGVASAVAFPVTTADFGARMARNPVSTPLQMVSGLTSGMIEDPLTTGADLVGTIKGGKIYSRAAGRVVSSKETKSAISRANEFMTKIKEAQPFKLAPKYGQVHKIQLRVDSKGYWEYGYKLGEDGVVAETWKWVEKPGTKLEKITVKDQIGTDIKLKYNKADLLRIGESLKKVPTKALKQLKKISPIEKVTRTIKPGQSRFTELITESGESLGKRRLPKSGEFPTEPYIPETVNSYTSYQLKAPHRAALTRAQKSISQAVERAGSRISDFELPDISKKIRQGRVKLSPWEDGVIGHELRFREVPFQNIELITETGKTIGKVLNDNFGNPSRIEMYTQPVYGKTLKPIYAKIVETIKGAPGNTRVTIKKLPKNLQKGLMEIKKVPKEVSTKLKLARINIPIKSRRLFAEAIKESKKQAVRRTEKLPLRVRNEPIMELIEASPSEFIVRERVPSYRITESGKKGHFLGMKERFTKVFTPKHNQLVRSPKGSKLKVRINPATIESINNAIKNLKNKKEVIKTIQKELASKRKAIENYSPIRRELIEERANIIGRETVPQYTDGFITESGKSIKGVRTGKLVDRFTYLGEKVGYRRGKWKYNPTIENKIKNYTRDAISREIYNINKDIQRAKMKWNPRVIKRRLDSVIKKAEIEAKKHYGPKERYEFDIDPEAMDIIEHNIIRKRLGKVAKPDYIKGKGVKIAKKPFVETKPWIDSKGRDSLARILDRIAKGESKFKRAPKEFKKITPEQAKAITDTLKKINEGESTFTVKKRVGNVEITPKQAKAISETLKKMSKGESNILRSKKKVQTEITSEKAKAISEDFKRMSEGRSNKQKPLKVVYPKFTEAELAKIAETFRKINKGTGYNPKRLKTVYPKFTEAELAKIAETFRKINKGTSYKYKRPSKKFMTLDDVLTKGERGLPKESIQTGKRQVQVMETKPVIKQKKGTGEIDKKQTTPDKKVASAGANAVPKTAKTASNAITLKREVNIIPVYETDKKAMMDLVRDIKKLEEVAVLQVPLWKTAKMEKTVQNLKRTTASKIDYKTLSMIQTALITNRAKNAELTMARSVPGPKPVTDTVLIIPPIKRATKDKRKKSKKKKKKPQNLRRYQDPYERFTGQAKYSFKWNTLLRNMYGNLYT